MVLPPHKVSMAKNCWEQRRNGLSRATSSCPGKLPNLQDLTHVSSCFTAGWSQQNQTVHDFQTLFNNNFRESVIPKLYTYLYRYLCNLYILYLNIRGKHRHIPFTSTVVELVETEARGASGPYSPARPTSWPPQRPG